jgi:acyl carrier protein
MSTESIKEIIVDAVLRIAPEVDRASIRTDADLRAEFDLDSIDFLNLILALHDRLGVEIPEADYGQFATIDSASRYLAARTSGKAN